MSDGTRILFPDFRDEQRDSRYPFVDTATLMSTNGVVEVQRDTFIDAVFHIIGSTGNLYISRVKVMPRTITIYIGDEVTRELAYVSFSPTPVQNTVSGALQVYDMRNRPAGMLVTNAEKISLFAGWPLGDHTFDADATKFVPTVIIPANEPGVRGLTTDSTSKLLTGDVWLIGDNGVVFRYEGEQDGKQIIRVDVVGVPLFVRNQCQPTDRFQPKNFVKTINNCPPDEYGNFTLTATGQSVEDTVLRITQNDGIIFIDAVGRKVV